MTSSEDEEQRRREIAVALEEATRRSRNGDIDFIAYEKIVTRLADPTQAKKLLAEAATRSRMHVGFSPEFIAKVMKEQVRMAAAQGAKYPLRVIVQSRHGVGMEAVMPAKEWAIDVESVKEWMQKVAPGIGLQEFGHDLGGSIFPIRIDVHECDPNGKALGDGWWTQIRKPHFQVK